MKRVAMLSLWRNDANRWAKERAEHLLSKTYPNLRLVWVVGDSSDNTLAVLQEAIKHGRREVVILNGDTGILGETLPERLRRLGVTANVGFDTVRPDDDYWMIHESDLASPSDIVDRFVAHAEAGRSPIAGWPILPFGNGQAVFYDIWAYRKDGQLFSNCPPFHPCYRPDEPFEVDSVGSCWMFHAEDLRAGVRERDKACLDLCDGFRARGRHIWVDPTLVIVQPPAMWVPHEVIP